MRGSGNSEMEQGGGLYLVGMGANLPSKHGSPLETLIAALSALEARDIRVLARSPWFESEPVPRSDQSWFINAIACVITLNNSYNILKILHQIEIEFGRERSVPNAARPLDLDLLVQIDGPPQRGTRQTDRLDLSGNALVLPHPRLQERRFVLQPLAAIAPHWTHPESGLTAGQMLATLPQTPLVRLLPR